MAGMAGYKGDVLMVANPISGGGKAGRWADDVAEALRAAGVTPHLVRTGKSGDAREAAAEFTGGLILAFGGDGTFNEVLNGADLDRCVLGLLPAGTGNVLGKELKLCGTAARAVELLRTGRVTRFDLGVCNERRFISMVGFGADAHIVRLIHESRAGRMSQIRYVPLVAREVVRLHDWDIEAAADGRVFVRHANYVCIGNTHSYGGPIEMTPAASPTDGELDVMAVRARSIVDYLAPGLALPMRSLHLGRSVLYGRGVRFRLTSSGEDVPWQVDGDPGGVLPAEVHCEPNGVRLVVPGGFRSRASAYG